MSGEFSAVFSSDDRTSGTTHDFTIRLSPAMKLRGRYQVSLQDFSTWYTWFNVSDDYLNTGFKYSIDAGANWTTISITPGIYNASALIAAIRNLMISNTHNPDNLVIGTNQNTQKFILTLAGGYQVDFTDMPIGTLFGADSAVYTTSGPMPNVAAMTNGVNSWYLHSDLIDYGIAGQFEGRILHSFNPQVEPGSNIRETPNTYYVDVKSGHTIESVRFWLTDQTGRPLNINNEPMSIRLHFKPSR